MPGARPTTTIKVSRRVMQFIEDNAKSDESVDEALRRLLKVPGTKPKVKGPLPLTTTIKVTRDLMKHIKGKAKKKESRDMTLGRLLGVEPDDGNLLSAVSVPSGIDRESTAVRPNDGNVGVAK